MCTDTARGFTVLELLIVLVVVGIALAMALPRIVAMRQNIILDSAAQQLVGDLRRAQVEAIKRNASIGLERTGATTYTIDSIGARSLTGGVAFGPTSWTSVRMAAFGPPVGGGASFILELGVRAKTVSVSAAGYVSVQ